jgi:hypothetical protein
MRITFLTSFYAMSKFAAFAAASAIMIAASPTHLQRTAANDAEHFHAHLKRSIPAANDTLATAPGALDLWFTEEPEVAVTVIGLSDASGRAVSLAKPRQDEKDATHLTVSLKGRMTLGAYRVDWRTMGRDGHVVHGSFAFALRPTK